ncbi:MAG TPA: glycoside hydrolase 100 family protein [Anaerolineae bacterium]
MKTLIDEAYQQAVDLLRRSVTDHGFRASALKPGYPQVWARDSIITGLGAALAGDPDLEEAFRASLDTLGGRQSSLGLIPLNVEPDTGDISSENAGAVDANLWFVLGHFYHYVRSHDLGYLKQNWPRIQRSVIWLRYQDMNECGLLEVPEAGDWMDLLAVRYNVLYDNVLYGAALQAEARIAQLVGAEVTSGPSAADVNERLNLLMWVDRCWVPAHFAEHLEQLKRMRLEWYMLYHNIGTISSRPFYLPWVAFREYGDYCDSLGNLLAVLCGVADVHRADHILRYLYQVGMAQPFPTKAIYPAIQPGNSEWREYYRSRNLNLPDQYHNGGIWPFIGGFHVAALVKMGWMNEARALLADLASACRLGVHGEWEFNEWMHGRTGHPMGYAHQAWSAGMFVYAYHAVESGRVPLFDELCGPGETGEWSANVERKTDETAGPR